MVAQEGNKRYYITVYMLRQELHPFDLQIVLKYVQLHARDT